MTAPEVGATFDLVIVENLTRTQLVQYAGASGDFNPVHSDEVYATQVAGDPTIFAPGLLTMGMTARLITDWFGDGSLKRFSFRFRDRVWPGDTLTARGTVRAVESLTVEVDLSVVNQGGKVVATGSAVAVPTSGNNL
jgi:adhesin HecA-like repeat protein